MSSYVQRKSSSPLLEWVWYAQPVTSGSYMDLASEYWHVAFLIEEGITRILLNGPASVSRPISYEGGQYYWGFVFKSHVFMAKTPKRDIVNAVIDLPVVDRNTFLFADEPIQIPTFDTAEQCVDQLVAKNLVVADERVASALRGNPFMSQRSVQRHVAASTGLNLTQLRQIKRARQAFALLQQGVPLVEVAARSGYSDQAHLTKSLKVLAGQTPGQILADYNPR